MIRTITRLIDSTSMYRLLVIYLGALCAGALVLGFVGMAPNPGNLALSLILALGTAEAANRLFARISRIPANRESSTITALLIVLLMSPPAATDLPGVGAIIAATLWAIASKYLLRIDRKHVFNPAAIGVALSALLLDQPALWWAGSTPWLLPVTLVGGLVVLAKIRRPELVLGTVAAYFIGTLLITAPEARLDALATAALRSPIWFLAFTMVTEPFTAPPGRWRGLLFGLLAGAFATPGLEIGPVAFTPELALLLANLFALLVSPRDRQVLTLKAVETPADNVLDLVFTPRRRLRFRPGQYLEWTLPLRDTDQRGNRRYFTIASAPGEGDIRLGVKLSPEPSAYKRALVALRPGDTVHVGQLGGSFTLPRRKGQKLAFIAGGIGITPFRSMIAHLLLTRDARPAVLLYGAATPGEFAYSRLFEQAKAEIGLQTTYVAESAADEARGIGQGLITAALIARDVPDYRERLFFVSGPPAMVRAVRTALHELGVRRSRIRTDFFPGLSA